MMRDEGRTWSVTTVAWFVAGSSLLMSGVIAAAIPVLLPIPVGAGIVLAVPRLRSGRTPVFAAALAAWGITLVPSLGVHADIETALLFAALALLAAGIAREEGVGRRLGAWLRRPRVQGGLTLVALAPIVVAGLFSFDRALRADAIPSAWRLLLVPLLGLVLVPVTRGYSLWRVLPALLILGGAGFKTAADPHDPVVAAAYAAANAAVGALFLAAWAHEGLAKLRPRRPTEPLTPGSGRVSSGSGVA